MTLGELLINLEYTHILEIVWDCDEHFYVPNSSQTKLYRPNGEKNSARTIIEIIASIRPLVSLTVTMSFKSMLLLLFIAGLAFINVFLGSFSNWPLFGWAFSFFVFFFFVHDKNGFNQPKGDLLSYSCSRAENLCIKYLLTIKPHRTTCSLFYTSDFSNFIQFG